MKKPLLEDFSPYLYRTHDFGRTWTKIVTGIPANDYTHVVREDPTRRGLLYAGTQHGFYVSFDDGDHWQPLKNGLPDTPVHDIWVEAADVAIATHGRGFYILDDVAPLRQYGAPVTTATNAYLFKPSDATRSAYPGKITYWLKKPAQKATLEILDSGGKVMRTFNGAAPNAGRGGRGSGRVLKVRRVRPAAPTRRRIRTRIRRPTRKKAADADAAVRRRSRWRPACSASPGICSTRR